jgi:hypothetical protein
VSVIAGGGGGAVSAVLLASAVVPPAVVLLLVRVGVVWVWSKSADTGEGLTLRQVARRALWLEQR